MINGERLKYHLENKPFSPLIPSINTNTVSMFHSPTPKNSTIRSIQKQEMAAATKLLLGTLLFFFLKANGQRCDLSSILIGVMNTGQKSGYDPVFEVEVKNTCRCTLTNVFLHSEGFTSTMEVDPKLFRKEGADYLVNDGKGIPSSVSVKFQYAWDRAFRMTPSAFQVACW